MGVLRVSGVILLIFVCGSYAPAIDGTPPTQPAPRPWFQKKRAETQLSSTTTLTNPEDLLNLIRASQTNAPPNTQVMPPGSPVLPSSSVPSGFPVPVPPPGVTGQQPLPDPTAPTDSKFKQAAAYANTKVNQAFNAANNKATQVAGTAMKGKDQLVNALNRKKTTDELKLELNDLIPKLEKAIFDAKYLQVNAPSMSQEQLALNLKSIKDALKPAVGGDNPIISQVKQAKDNIQSVVNNPSSIKDYKAVQAVTNHPITQGVAETVKNHPVTKKITEMASPLIEKFYKREAAPIVM